MVVIILSVLPRWIWTVALEPASAPGPRKLREGRLRTRHKASWKDRSFELQNSPASLLDQPSELRERGDSVFALK
jgi:hypothetical protein